MIEESFLQFLTIFLQNTTCFLFGLYNFLINICIIFINICIMFINICIMFINICTMFINICTMFDHSFFLQAMIIKLLKIFLFFGMMGLLLFSISMVMTTIMSLLMYDSHFASCNFLQIIIRIAFDLNLLTSNNFHFGFTNKLSFYIKI